MNITGTTINGYFLKEFIDSGGFGAVYKAEKDGKTYAIKIFREDYVLNTDFHRVNNRHNYT